MIPSEIKPCQKGAAPTAPFGVLLVNLGSPDAPTASSVRRYLAEFLSDRRVVDSPRWLWLPILHGIILRIRPAKVAKLYQSVWQQDAPLRVISQQQAKQLGEQLTQHLGTNIPVVLGMTYGNPSLRDALLQLRAASVKNIVVLPLYPQFSCSTTASVFDRVNDALGRCRHLPSLRFVQHYYANSQYIEALKKSVERHWQQNGRAEKLLISFHGLPQRYVDEGDPYARHCEITAQQLAHALQLNDSQWQIVFQSRFGREPWLQPYADLTIQTLAEQGTKTLDVICPGFAADCLETLEEISVRAQEQFVEHGGNTLRYIPALNTDDLHIQMMVELVKREAMGWF